MHAGQGKPRRLHFALGRITCSPDASPCVPEEGSDLNRLAEKPLVSIITPSYNTGAFIEQTLCSVALQDYPRIEHIVLDSGSTDGSREILARHPSVHLVASAPQGLSAKVNQGFAMARGDIVGWLNADDFYLPGAISSAVDAFRRNPDAAMVYCNFLLVDERGAEIERERTRQADWREMLARNFVPLEGAFIRREVLEQVGPVSSRFPLVQDWDLWLRISKRFPVVHVDEWWGAFRVRPGQRCDVYKFDYWLQARTMTQEHGGRLLPLFRHYWGQRLRRAGGMLHRREFGRIRTKLHEYIRSVGRREETGHRTDY